MFSDLAKMTYRVEHNPNCPSPFKISLPGLMQKWAVGFGLSLDDAAAAALKQLAGQRSALMRAAKIAA